MTFLQLLLIAVVWVIPALGILINSFRNPQAIQSSGWWTVIGEVFNAETWTLQNYATVLDQGFGNAFANSLAVTIPAVAIPITVAAFALTRAVAESPLVFVSDEDRARLRSYRELRTADELTLWDEVFGEFYL